MLVSFSTQLSAADISVRENSRVTKGPWPSDAEAGGARPAFAGFTEPLAADPTAGTSATAAATVNQPSRYRFGTVGPALPGVELRIADDGEVLIKTETIYAGYYKDEQATQEVLPGDGWLRSGDVGHMNEDGFLTITDRKKDILVTAGGKNVAPQNLENALKTHPLVSQALVVGDRRPYVAALITLVEGTTPDEARQEIERFVEDVNGDLSRFEQIKRYTILPRDFSADEGEVTPTLKLKRRVCQEHFAAEIEALYS